MRAFEIFAAHGFGLSLGLEVDRGEYGVEIRCAEDAAGLVASQRPLAVAPAGRRLRGTSIAL